MKAYVSAIGLIAGVSALTASCVAWTPDMNNMPLTTDGARERVRAACVGKHATRGGCDACVAYSLSALEATGNTAIGARESLTIEFAEGSCKAMCVPTSCTLAGKTCGTVSDGCGGALDCGTCESVSCSPTRIGGCASDADCCSGMCGPAGFCCEASPSYCPGRDGPIATPYAPLGRTRYGY